ncbi:MAG: sterol desaturase family protein [Rhizobiales bacterium]|nr:sterol desaturase family protein [Hyphomicrobiales bacterium]
MEDFGNLLYSKLAWIIAFMMAVLIAERIFPMAKVHVANRIARLAKNFTLAGINTVLSPLIVIPLSAYAAQYALDWRPVWWSGWSGLAADILILDFWIYWWHRANHVVPFLWRFHEIHHLDETLDASSAVRFHFGEVLLSALVRGALIFLLDVPLASVVVFETLLFFSTVFHHSNMRLPREIEAPLSRLIVTPSIHWVHHHAIRRDTDSNYATLLSVWDRLFASRSATARTEEMPVGVEREFDRPLPQLISRPFRRIVR